LLPERVSTKKADFKVVSADDGSPHEFSILLKSTGMSIPTASNSLFNPGNLLERLRHNTLFENLDDHQFERIRSKLVQRRYAAHAPIIEEMIDGDKLYLIAEGRVKITKNTKYRDESLIALLHHGDFFGELELIDGRPRMSRVTAVEDCILYELAKDEFHRLLSENHPFTTRLLEVLSVRLRAINHHFVQEMDRHAEHTLTELQKLQRLIDAAKTVNSTLDLDKLLAIIVESALNIVGGAGGTLYLIDENRQELWSKVLKGLELIEIRLPVGKGIAGYVAATGDVQNIPDAYLDPRFNPEIDEKTGFHTSTILCVPMRNKDKKIIGVLQLINKTTGVFTSDDVSFIEALSIHAAIAIENARLYEQEREKIALEKDILAAREVQLILLPKEIPKVTGYDIAGESITAKMVGGDYFDFIPLARDRLAICVGDVSGKGLPASLLMANLQATLRGQTIIDAPPNIYVRRSNRLMWQTTSAEKFATLFFGILDLNGHTLHYVNAGQNYPILISSDCSQTPLTTGGIPLGMLEDCEYEEEVVAFTPESILVMYSDGVSEAFNKEKQQFGDEHVISIVCKLHNESAQTIVDAILDEVHIHSTGVPQLDDLTVVVVKRH
jgi:sigma-B regulation protein RsbU (phosphoserine phosphatase)